MLLQQNGREIADRVDRRLREFETSFERLQLRVGKLLAQQINDAAAENRAELQRDIDAARINAQIPMALHERKWELRKYQQATKAASCLSDVLRCLKLVLHAPAPKNVVSSYDGER
jgi:predicted amidophosphoribosyltransferase